jgi:hypothetical protein
VARTSGEGITCYVAKGLRSLADTRSFNRSVHNIRIERLWVDVTSQFGAKWADLFRHLEIDHGLDVNNHNHLWLLHYLFLPDINADACFFAESWNKHKIQSRGQASRSPEDMWYFDQIALGVRGDDVSSEELELYGVDWEGLRDDQLMDSHFTNDDVSHSVEWTPWAGRSGPPPQLSNVPVEPPVVNGIDIDGLYGYIQPYLGHHDRDSLLRRWSLGLAFLRSHSSLY